MMPFYAVFKGQTDPIFWPVDEYVADNRPFKNRIQFQGFCGNKIILRDRTLTAKNLLSIKVEIHQAG